MLAAKQVCLPCHIQQQTIRPIIEVIPQRVRINRDTWGKPPAPLGKACHGLPAFFWKIRQSQGARTQGLGLRHSHARRHASLSRNAAAARDDFLPAPCRVQQHRLPSTLFGCVPARPRLAEHQFHIPHREIDGENLSHGTPDMPMPLSRIAEHPVPHAARGSESSR